MSYPARSDKQELLAMAERLNDGLAQVEREIAENPAPPMRLVPVPLIMKLVPYNELPEVGAGGIWAAAIRHQLEEGPSDDISFAPLGMATKQCMNCGYHKRASDVDGGWCRSCEGE